MNRLLTILLSGLVLSSFGLPQKTKPRLPEYFVNIPAGTYYTGESESNKPTILSGNLYMSSYEVSNLQYREFLNEIWSSLSSEGRNQVMYDSTGWTKINKAAAAMTRDYHSNSSYNDYPVVNITHAAALKYCLWLQGKIQQDNPSVKVEVRLPTKNEWIACAMGGRSQAMFPWANYYLKNNKGAYLCNFKIVPDNLIYTNRQTGKPEVAENYSTGTSLYTTKVNSFSKNRFGLYNMCGNAAEMIDQEGISMGGSWNDYGGDIHTRSESAYLNSKATVGFRPVIIINEK